MSYHGLLMGASPLSDGRLPCPKCGYDCRAAVESCPECGWVGNRQDLIRYYNDSVHQQRLFATKCWVAPTIAIGVFLLPLLTNDFMLLLLAFFFGAVAHVIAIVNATVFARPIGAVTWRWLTGRSVVKPPKRMIVAAWLVLTVAPIGLVWLLVIIADLFWLNPSAWP